MSDTEYAESGRAATVGFLPAISGSLRLRCLQPRNGTAKFTVVSRPRRVMDKNSPATVSARPGIGQATLKNRELASGRFSAWNSPFELVVTVVWNPPLPDNVSANNGRISPDSALVRTPCTRRG